MRPLTLFLLALMVASPAQARDKEATFGAQEFTLSNGLQVVVIPNHRAPVVTHMMWMKVGGADSAPGVSGMPHYLEHLMFKGTTTTEPGSFSRTVKILGGNDNAFTGQDYTAYHETISVDNLEKVMRMEADRMVNLAPPESHYKSEKEVVLEERRQRTDNDPKAEFGEQMQSVLFVNHPYANPVIGWMDEIKRYEWPDIKKFYDLWYAPNNAILVVSGDITAEQLKPLAEKIYGGLKKKDIPKRVRPAVPPAISTVQMTLHHKDIRQPVFQKTFIAPSDHQNRKDSLALQVLAEILDGGSTTRFYKSLVVEQKKAISVEFYYNSTALDYGSIGIAATPADGVSLEELDRLTQAEIQKVIDKGVTAKELKDAIQRLQDDAIYARDSLTGPAMVFGAALSTGSSVADVEYWSRDIARVTAQDVQKAAMLYLNPTAPWVRPPVIGYLLPEAQTEVITTPQAPADPSAVTAPVKEPVKP